LRIIQNANSIIQLYQEHRTRIQILQYYNNLAKVPILCKITDSESYMYYRIKKKNQSVKQDFFGNYNRFIRTNTEFKLQCINQYLVENLNQFYQDYQKLIQSFN